MPETAIDVWPNCPECGQPRHTNCPICQTAGHEFPPAHLPDTQIPEKPLVVCPTCDEPFTPEYLRACEWCDFRFEDGLETNSSYSSPDTPINRRAIAVLAVTTLLIAVIGGYFLFFL